MNYCLEAYSVTKTYNAGKHNEVSPIKDVSVQIAQGQITVLKGPSGSGKTTLLSILGGHIKPSRGEVILCGKTISKLPERFMNRHKRKFAGFIFQQFQLIGDLSVLDNILLPLLPEGMPLEQRIKMADEQLSFLELTHRRDFKVRDLSGGEQQRVAIARALINHPQVILADEPTAHLDHALSQDFLTRMTQLKEAGHTILMTSHDPALYDSPKIDRVIQMQDGSILS